MNDRDIPGRPDPSDRDLAIATLLGRYIERRGLHETPCVHDLLAAAAESGDNAAHELRDVIAFYEAMLVSQP